MGSTTSEGRCLVLGGRGFIGSHLVDRLLSDGVPTRVLIRRPPADAAPLDSYKTHELLEVFSGDFNNEMDLLNAMDDCESCVHLISSTLPKTSNENMIYDIQTNLVGTVRLLQYAKKIGVKKVTFISSGGAVYGDAQHTPIDEGHPTVPKSSYGITKLASEKYMLLFADAKLSTTVLRFSNPYGPRQRTTINQGAVAVFLSRALKHQDLEIWGDGEVVRDYVYISDCVSAIVKSLHHQGPHQLFNIGSGIGRSLNEIVASVETVLGQKIKVSYGAARGLDAARNVLNIDHARQHLGWSPVVSFQDGLPQTAEWYRSTMR